MTFQKNVKSCFLKSEKKRKIRQLEHWFDVSPARRTPANIRIHLIFPETIELLDYILPLIVWFYLHSNFCIFSAYWPFKVIQSRWFLYQRKRICHFLLVRHSNLGPILHRLWDTATYWLKIAYFPTLSCLSFGAPAPMFPIGISRWSWPQRN